MAYDTASQLIAERGTLEMWIEVGDSLDDELEWNPLFTAQGQPYQPFRGILLQFIEHSRKIAFVAGSLEHNALVAAIEWNKGEAHYIAATWSERGIALFIDGNQVAQNSQPAAVGKLPPRMAVGGYLWEHARNPANTVIDELRISSVPRTREQIAAVAASGDTPTADDLTLLLDHYSGPEDVERPTASARKNDGKPGWMPHADNPVISIARPPEGLPRRLQDASLLIWNDPSVLKEGDDYSMWLSLGTRGGPQDVAIYRLRSSDGIRWALANDGKPVLSGGDKRRGDFDWFGVETPVVIKVGNTWHMYYSVYKNGKVPLVTMGHATSSNGTDWTKHGELLSLTQDVGRHAGNPWGRLARGEPAVVHRDGTFYLYFTDVRCRTDDCSSFPAAVRGISLATSKDGHVFKQHGTEPIVHQSTYYSAEKGFEGYSTPWVFHDGGVFWLFCDVFHNNGRDSVQSALLRLRSDDGIHFEEVSRDDIVAGDQPWSAVSVRSPSVIRDNGRLRMWYAGDGFDSSKHGGSDIRSGRVQIGIGEASLPEQDE